MYFIHDQYTERLNNADFDDTLYKDEHQREVYEHAVNLFREENLNSVLDIGCGSGYKLVKNFSTYDNVVGFDINKETVKFLRKTYPQYIWVDYMPIHIANFDLVICSDVIEHVKDPDLLLNEIKEFNPKFLVISTPDRDKLSNTFGPPKNPAHVREWGFREFDLYISHHFYVIKHFTSNEDQHTQCIICRPLAVSQ